MSNAIRAFACSLGVVATLQMLGPSIAGANPTTDSICANSELGYGDRTIRGKSYFLGRTSSEAIAAFTRGKDALGNKLTAKDCDLQQATCQGVSFGAFYCLKKPSSGADSKPRTPEAVASNTAPAAGSTSAVQKCLQAIVQPGQRGPNGTVVIAASRASVQTTESPRAGCEGASDEELMSKECRDVRRKTVTLVGAYTATPDGKIYFHSCPAGARSRALQFPESANGSEYSGIIYQEEAKLDPSLTKHLRETGSMPMDVIAKPSVQPAPCPGDRIADAQALNALVEQAKQAAQVPNASRLRELDPADAAKRRASWEKRELALEACQSALLATPSRTPEMDQLLSLVGSQLNSAVAFYGGKSGGSSASKSAVAGAAGP